MTPSPKWLAVTIVACALAFVQPAVAQWAWRDAGGRMVFSDQPPPASIPAKDIVRQPSAAPVSAPGADDGAKGEASSDTKPQPPRAQAARPRAPTAAEREIEWRRRQQELADAEKKSADEDTQRAKTAQNCERLRSYLRALEGGFRIARVNASGQQEILDDNARASERERTQAEIEQNCQ